MKYSISQITTAIRCTRKWFFQTIARMPQPPRKFGTTFGSVLHREIERILLDQPSFPAGWENWIERGVTSTVPPHEAEQIRELIAAAIKAGFIVPLPAQEIEQSFSLPLPGDLGTFWGKIDLLHREGVTDWKSASTPTYLLKQEELYDDPQLVAYARVYFHKYPEAQTAEIAHGQFVRQPLQVRKIKAIVTREQVEKVWNERLLPIIARMAEQLSKGEADWAKIPGPHAVGACRDYNGCPWESICSHRETPAQFRARMSQQQQPPTNDNMSANRFAALAGIAPASAPTPAPTPAAPAQAAAPAQSLPAATPPVAAPTPAVGTVRGDGLTAGPIIVDPDAPKHLSAAPWANSDCTNEKCRGRGYTDEAKSCLPCSRAYKAKTTRNGSDDFKTHYDTATNRLTWTGPDGRVYQLALAKNVKAGAEKPATVQAPTQTTPKELPKTISRAEAEAIVDGISQDNARVLSSLVAMAAAGAPSAEELRSPIQREAAASARLDGETQVMDIEAATKAALAKPAKATGDAVEAKLVAQINAPKKSDFILVIGTVPLVRDSRKTLDLEVLFIKMKEVIGAANPTGTQGFESLDTWRRRDALTALASRYAQEEMGSVDLAFAPQGSPDLKTLIDAFRPFAQVVIDTGRA